jgi:hypothetical protein
MKRAEDQGDPAPYRERWLGVLRNFPDLSQKQLQRQAPHVYSWLAYHDGDWLRAHWPPPKTTHRRKWIVSPEAVPQTDEMTKREEANRRLADAVIKAAGVIKPAPGEPLRITKNRLRYYFPSLLPQSLSRVRFPVTFAAMRQVSGTWEDLLLRRIEYVVGRSDCADQPWTLTKLMKATVAKRHKSAPRIKQALDDAMMVLLRADH